MRKAALILACLASSSCASVPRSPALPPTLTPARPQVGACQLPRVADACRFRPQLVDLSLDDQLAFIANCAVIAGEALRDCDAKKRVLEEWFDAGEPPADLSKTR